MLNMIVIGPYEKPLLRTWHLRYGGLTKISLAQDLYSASIPTDRKFDQFLEFNLGNISLING